jgi:hypothetical protein
LSNEAKKFGSGMPGVMDLLSRTTRVACSESQAYWHCVPELVKAEADLKIANLVAEATRKRLEEGLDASDKPPKIPVIGIYNQVAREQWDKVKRLRSELVDRVRFYQKNGYELHEERPQQTKPGPPDYQRYVFQRIF